LCNTYEEAVHLQAIVGALSIPLSFSGSPAGGCLLLHEAARRTVPAAQYTLLRSTSTYYARLYSIQLIKTVKYCTTTGSRSVGTSTGSGNKIPAAAFVLCTLSFFTRPTLALPACLLPCRVRPSCHALGIAGLERQLYPARTAPHSCDWYTTRSLLSQWTSSKLRPPVGSLHREKWPVPCPLGPTRYPLYPTATWHPTWRHPSFASQTPPLHPCLLYKAPSWPRHWLTSSIARQKRIRGSEWDCE
jgi:hypothetical protein